MNALDGSTEANACAPGQTPLAPHRASVMLVIDRSFAMGEPFLADAPGTTTMEWDGLRSTLRAQLPTMSRLGRVGAVFYPLWTPESCDGTLPCGIATRPEAELSDGPSQVLAVADRTTPYGMSPMNDAVLQAARALGAGSDSGRYLFLMIGGLPDCNGALDLASCTCIDGFDESDARCQDPSDCLDDDRTVATVRSFASHGIVTYVFGFDDGTAAFGDFLDRMAVAGGRPRPAGGPRDRRVQSGADLQSELSDVLQTIERCTFVTGSIGEQQDDATIRLQGVALPRDTTHREGWDWTDRSSGEIVLFGHACDDAAAADANGVVPTIDRTCP